MCNISTIYISNHLRASVARAIPRVQLQPRSETVEKALWMRLVQLYWLAEANHRQFVRTYRLTYRPPSFMRMPNSRIMKI